MKTTWCAVLVVVGVLVAGSTVRSAPESSPPPEQVAGAPDVRPDDYPEATPEEWGQLRRVLYLAGKELDDFSDWNQVAAEAGLSGYRYSFAFANYFLAAEQYHKFPAWPDAIRTAMDRINRKMILKPAWRYWYDTGTCCGRRVLMPEMNQPFAPDKDPVRVRNVMYSGHLSMMLNLYQMLYGDRPWDRPGSIVFAWDEDEKFVYDNRSLQDAMFTQAVNNPVPGVECEPNAIFPECNTHSMIGWMLYDRQHGSRYFSSIRPAFDAWYREAFVNPETLELGEFYLVEQGHVFSNSDPRFDNKLDPILEALQAKGTDFNSAANDAWQLLFIHAWDPGLVEKLYPAVKRRYVTMHPDGSATLTGGGGSYDVHYGFMTALAAEMGDTPLRDALLKTAAADFHPVWRDGMFYYPYRDDMTYLNVVEKDGRLEIVHKPHDLDLDRLDASAEKFLASIKAKGEAPNAGAVVVKQSGPVNKMQQGPQSNDASNMLFGLARALPPGGLHAMCNDPFDAGSFAEPKVAGLDPAAISLKRALYDRAKKALVVSTRALEGGGAVSFSATNLDPQKTYELFLDGRSSGRFTGQTTCELKADASRAQDWVLKET